METTMKKTKRTAADVIPGVNKTSERTMKAWAIVYQTPCEAVDETYDAWYTMIYQERKDAEKTLALEQPNRYITKRKDWVDWSIVPCTITYTLPKKPLIAKK